MSYNSQLMPMSSVMAMPVAVKSPLLSRHLVCRVREQCGPIRAESLVRCVYERCRLQREFTPQDQLEILTVDTPMSGENSTCDVLAFHRQCWLQYQTEDAPLYAANRVVLPSEIIAQEAAAGRSVFDFINLQAPSALAAAEFYDIEAPQVEVLYAAPDTPTGCSWVFSMPSGAADFVPLEPAVINERTFPSLFRRRAVLTVGMAQNLSINQLNKSVNGLMKEVMQVPLQDSERRAFKISEKAPMNVIADACTAAVFRHPFNKPDDSQRTYHKLVIEVAIPNELLGLTWEFFEKAFLNKDGDVLRENDRFVYSQIFKPPEQLPAEPPQQVQLLTGEVVAASKNSSRQFNNWRSWSQKLAERRGFLSDTLNTIVETVILRLAKGASVSRDSANDGFATRWTDDVVTTEQSLQNPKWTLLVNAQPVATFTADRNVNDLVYIVSEDFSSVATFVYDSREAKVNSHEYVPCVFGGDMGALSRELMVRRFTPVNEGTIEQIYVTGGQ